MTLTRPLIVAAVAATAGVVAYLTLRRATPPPPNYLARAARRYGAHWDQVVDVDSRRAPHDGPY